MIDTKRKTGLLFLLALITSLKTFSQSSQWGDFNKLYHDNQIDIEIKFSTPINPCVDAGSSFRYAYKINGKRYPDSRYVVWHLVYQSCGGAKYFETISIPVGGFDAEETFGTEPEVFDLEVVNPLKYNFSAEAIVSYSKDIILSSTPIVGRGLYLPAKSTKPSSISGPTLVSYKGAASYKLSDGELADGAQWIWFIDSCGAEPIQIGGDSLALENITNDFNLFVRAEKGSDFTDCVTLPVVVRKKSIAPNRIEAPEQFCPGEDITLKIQGGALGLNEDWYWHKGSSDGPVLASGEEVKLMLTETTKIYVRSEGPSGKGKALYCSVSMGELSIAPRSILSNKPTTICAGEEMVLVANGGKLAKDAYWEWTTNSCEGMVIGKGDTMSTTAMHSTTYFVKAVGGCFKTNCASLTTKVQQNSSAPYFISVPSMVWKGKTTELGLSGGKLGDLSKWVWYISNDKVDTKIGEGATLIRKFRKTTSIKVVGEGPCGISSPVTTTVYPIKFKHWKPAFKEYQDVNLHIGVSGGLSTVKYTYFDTTLIGIKFDVQLHPIYTKYFSIEIRSGISFGAKTNIPEPTQKTDFDKVVLLLDEQVDLALGANPIKMLVGVKKNSYSYLENNEWGRLAMIGGFRLGKTDKAKTLVDIYYTSNKYQKFSVLYDEKEFDRDYNTFGFGVNIWKVNKFHLFLDWSTFQPESEIDFNNIRLEESIVEFGFVFTRDRFL